MYFIWLAELRLRQQLNAKRGKIPIRQSSLQTSQGIPHNAQLFKQLSPAMKAHLQTLYK